jgi:hypothetical protein
MQKGKRGIGNSEMCQLLVEDIKKNIEDSNLREHF